jgi:thiamine biosynthesis lipoprotein
MRKISVFTAGVLALAVNVSCGSAGKKSAGSFFVTRTQVHMGTFISVSIPDDQVAHVDSVFNVFREMDAYLSSYKDTAEIARINEAGGGELSSPTEQCLRLALFVAEDTDGYFDPTIGALTLDLYKFGRGGNRNPSAQEIAQARKKVGYQKMKIDGTQVKLAPGMKLDLGGIGKGFAVDAAAARLRSEGVNSAVIAASGDIRCLHACQTAIADPRDSAKKLAIFTAAGEEFSISTSGVSERRGPGDIHHLLEPATGRSQQTFLSVTLVSQGGNALLDGVATAVSLMPEAKALEYLKRRPHLGYVLVTRKNELLYNTRFQEAVTDLRWLNNTDFKIRHVASRNEN